MNTEPNRDKHSAPCDADLEAALHAALRAKGHLFPQTAEDVASMKASLDLNGVPTPDMNKFRRLLRSQTTAKTIPMPAPLQATCHEIENDLAMVARNGGAIAAKIREKMDADKAKKRQQLPATKDEAE